MNTWHVLPGYSDRPNEPLIGTTDDSGKSYTIVCAVKSEWRASQIVTAMNAMPDMVQALQRFAKAMEQRSYPELQGIASDAFAALAKAGV